MPGGTICNVAICKSNSKKAKKEGETLMFFTFPKDPTVREEWMRKCYRKDKWDAANKRICSKHFKPNDFEDELQARLLNLQPRKLKKDAVPSQLLCPTEAKPEIFDRTQRKQQKKRKKIRLSTISRKIQIRT